MGGKNDEEAGGRVLKFPVAKQERDARILIVPRDLQQSIAAVALRTGYTDAEVLRFMLEEGIGMSRQRA